MSSLFIPFGTAFVFFEYLCPIFGHKWGNRIVICFRDLLTRAKYFLMSTFEFSLLECIEYLFLPEFVTKSEMLQVVKPGS